MRNPHYIQHNCSNVVLMPGFLERSFVVDLETIYALLVLTLRLSCCPFRVSSSGQKR